MKIQEKIIHVLFVAVICSQCVAQVKDEEKLAKKFVASLLNDSVAIESIADQFIRYQRDEKGKEFIVTFLGTIRSYLKKDGANVENLKIVGFRKAEDQLEDIIVTDEQKNHIYAVLTKDNKLLIPILIENNQVVSFTTLDKGKRKVFMSYGR